MHTVGINYYNKIMLRRVYFGILDIYVPQTGWNTDEISVETCERPSVIDNIHQKCFKIWYGINLTASNTLLRKIDNTVTFWESLMANQ